MRSDELLARVRLNCTLEDTAVDYPDSVILRELTDSGMTTFENMIVVQRAGYWLDTVDIAVATGVARYRIPARSCVQGLEKIELGIGSNPGFLRLAEVSESHAEFWTMSNGSLGQPQKFVVRGDQIVLLPTPDASQYTLRLYFYRRPSRLVAQQSSTLNSGVIRGLISAVDTVARTVVVNALPNDQEAVSAGVVFPTAIAPGTSLIDIVHPDGWHELAMMNQSFTAAGTTLTITGTADMSEIAIGDFVRAADQTDWPQLPDDFHRCLADTTSVKILAQRNMDEKAASFATAVSADIQRFGDILQPRVKSGALTIKAPMYSIRGRPRRYWPGFP